jgi:TetR/AcrR family transcriptional regulator, cholesterol catabolism regulator
MAPYAAAQKSRGSPPPARHGGPTSGDAAVDRFYLRVNAFPRRPRRRLDCAAAPRDREPIIRFVPRKQEVAAAEDAGSKSARTRERILDAAAHVLSRKGYAGTRLSDVADQAEIQAPAIYYYFPSRDDLIEEVMWSGIAHMREHMTGVLAALPADADPLDRIDAAVEAHLRYCLEISDYTTASIRNAGQVPEGIAIRYAAEASQYGDMWRKLLQDADNAGLLRPDLDPMAARMMVLGALNWAAEWWNPRRGSLDTVVRTAQSLVRHGLGHRPEGRAAEAAGSAARKPRPRRRPASG